MNEWAKLAGAMVLGVITLAIISVIVSKKSAALAVITDVGNELAKVVGAAVDPVTLSPNNGNLGNNTFTSPTNGYVSPNTDNLYTGAPQ